MPHIVEMFIRAEKSKRNILMYLKLLRAELHSSSCTNQFQPSVVAHFAILFYGLIIGNNKKSTYRIRSCKVEKFSKSSESNMLHQAHIFLRLPFRFNPHLIAGLLTSNFKPQDLHRATTSINTAFVSFTLLFKVNLFVVICA